MTITDFTPTGFLTEGPAPQTTDRIGRVELPCQSNDADLWFAEAPADLEAAKALCRDCPLQQPCLAEAVERGEPWGVWGGEIFAGGVIVARKRPRGRPRKNPLPEGS
ncbi:WhiB family transcriptional regulator [Gordonia iterans]